MNNSGNLFRFDPGLGVEMFNESYYEEHNVPEVLE
jgi:hypothetical protein